MMSDQAIRALDQEALPSPKAGQAAARHPRWFALLSLLGHLSPFAVTGIAYELLGPVFLAHHGRVHVADLWGLEAHLLSVTTHAGPEPLSEAVAQLQRPWLDVTCGLIYLLFLLEILGFTVYLFYRDRRRALLLSLGFLVANVIGWMIWVIYPAAPPWYVDRFGLGPVVRDVASNPAGMLRLDAWLGLPIAAQFYSKSADVFGAVPSLHVAYATLTAWVVAPLGGAARIVTLCFAAAIAFSAVYLRHHYIIDVLAGVILAVFVANLLPPALRFARMGFARMRFARMRFALRATAGAAGRRA